MSEPELCYSNGDPEHNINCVAGRKKSWLVDWEDISPHFTTDFRGLGGLVALPFSSSRADAPGSAMALIIAVATY